MPTSSFSTLARMDSVPPLYELGFATSCRIIQTNCRRHSLEDNCFQIVTWSSCGEPKRLIQPVDQSVGALPETNLCPLSPPFSLSCPLSVPPAMSLPSVPVRKLGSLGLQTAAQGLGCMGMSAFYKDPSRTHSGEEESIATIHRAKELGVTFLGACNGWCCCWHHTC